MSSLEDTIRELVLGPGDSPRLERLAEIAPALTPRLAARAAKIAAGDWNLPRGVYVLTRLAPRLDTRELERAVKEALRKISLTLDPTEAMQAVQLVALHLPAVLHMDAVLAASAIPEPRWQGLALAALAPSLEESSLELAVPRIAALEDPWDLTAAIVAVAPAVPERMLGPLQQATLRIGVPELRTLAVRAIDTQWEKVADRPAELRALVAQVPGATRRVVEERLADWLQPAPEAPPAGPVAAELEALIQRHGLPEVERCLDEALDELASRLAEKGRAGVTSRAAPQGVEPLAESGDALAGLDSDEVRAPSLEPKMGRDPSPPAPVPAAGAGRGEQGLPPPRSGSGLPTPFPGAPSRPAGPPQARPRPVVNTGFVDETGASQAGHTLICGRRYAFWLDVGLPRADSIEQRPTGLPPLPAGTELRVVVFGFPGQLEVPEGGITGDLRLQPDGSAVVARAADTLPAASPEERRRQLFFIIRAPSESGVYSLRCSIYHRQNLLQSRVVTARVGRSREADPGALASRVDYAISHKLDPKQLAGLQEQRLSLMLNDDGSGTHGLRFVGAGDFSTREVTIGEGVLKTSIEVVRRALHTVAWGAPDPWGKGRQGYRYERGGTPEQLAADLISLAARGYKLFIDLVGRLTGGRKGREELEALMRTPGAVQIALKQDAGHVLPAALFYDHPLDTQKDLTLCETFTAALGRAEPIGNGECLGGHCPSRGNDTVVCPSGFWGYRHRLGLPLSVAPGEDAPDDIPWNAQIELAMCVATNLEGTALHQTEVKALRKSGLEVVLADERDAVLRLLGEHPLQVVYFYCHGGYTQDGFPTLLVGQGGTAIAAENLTRIRWTSPRPLVFLNGCHTAALTPETMLDMVNAFVRESGAAGVIGTEITIFESLARP
ncbi:MAG TPA: hypothetical protein VND93_25880, partial [Myxococcales bacterium]|nr:hypothetical protein [Myxococcales bacterium]